MGKIVSEAEVYRKNKRNYLIILIFGIVLALFVFCSSLCIGNYHTTISDVINAILHPQENQSVYKIITLSRLPRLLGAILVGTSLSVSGVVYQELFNNRMASPDILGVSSGASVGASISIYFGLGFALTGLFAFIGGVIAVVCTIFLAKLFGGSKRQTIALVIAGIVVGGLMSSVLGLFKYLSNDAQLSSITFWLLGGLYNTTYSQLIIAGPIIIVGVVILMMLRWRILMLRNGDFDASLHGINTKATKYTAIAIATIITALSICISGTIGWVGLAIPNLMMLVCNNDEKRLMPLSIVYGILFLEIADLLARTLTNTEIPVGVITGFLGAVIFIIVIIIQKAMVRKHD